MHMREREKIGASCWWNNKIEGHGPWKECCEGDQIEGWINITSVS